MTQINTPQHIKLDERNHVEKPFLDQLSGLGWEIIDMDNKQHPGDTFRETFTEVVMLPVLREQLKVINDWLEEDQVEEVVKQLTANFPGTGLIENNRHVLNLLLENTSISENRKTGEKSPTVCFIDFEHRDNNRFIAVCQFKVRILGTEYHIIPDIVLFLNGLPVVVIECKSPKVKEPMVEAIDQMLRYSEQRGARGEGSGPLFYYNQFKGFVVDYVGIGHHLKKAIQISDEREQREVLDALSFPEKELNELRDVHRSIMAFFKKHGLNDLNDHDAFFDLFYDENLRFEYLLAFKKFTKSLNLVFPAKEALDFMLDYQQLSEINVLAGKHFRDARLSMKGIPPKLRGITDAYLASKGINLKVAPISILDQDFESQVGKRKRSKTKAAEVEHAIRHHLDVDLDDDPDLQASFAQAPTMEKAKAWLKENGQLLEQAI